MVGELHRRCTSAALGAIDHNEVGRDAAGQHGLHHGKPFPGVADAQFDAGRLAARQLTQLGDELHHGHGRGKGAVRGRRHTIHSHRYTARLGDLSRHLGAGQHAAVSRLGALAELDLDQLDLRTARVFSKLIGVEAAVGVAAAKVARADFPDQVTAVHPVMR